MSIAETCCTWLKLASRFKGAQLNTAKLSLMEEHNAARTLGKDGTKKTATRNAFGFQFFGLKTGESWKQIKKKQTKKNSFVWGGCHSIASKMLNLECQVDFTTRVVNTPLTSLGSLVSDCNARDSEGFVYQIWFVGPVQLEVKILRGLLQFIFWGRPNTKTLLGGSCRIQGRKHGTNTS